MNTRISVMTVVTPVSRRDGQATLDTSARTCWRNVNGLVFAAKVDSSKMHSQMLHHFVFKQQSGPSSINTAQRTLVNCCLSIAGLH
jgi:hypothetical protein